MNLEGVLPGRNPTTDVAGYGNSLSGGAAPAPQHITNFSAFSAQDTHPLTVTDLNPGLRFHVQQVRPVAMDNASKTGRGNDFNVDATAEKNQMVAAAYMEAHQNQVAEFQDLLTAANGVDVANRVSGALFAPPGSDTCKAAVEVLDPTANLLNVYDAIATLNKECNAPNRDEILEAIGKMQNLSANLHEAAEDHENAGKTPPVPPPSVPWHEFPAEQIMATMQRDVMYDPVMQDIAENERAIEAIQENQIYVGEHDRDNVSHSPEKIAEAMRGNLEGISADAVIAGMSLQSPCRGASCPNSALKTLTYKPGQGDSVEREDDLLLSEPDSTKTQMSGMTA